MVIYYTAPLQIPLTPQIQHNNSLVNELPDTPLEYGPMLYTLAVYAGTVLSYASDPEISPLEH